MPWIGARNGPLEGGGYAGGWLGLLAAKETRCYQHPGCPYIQLAPSHSQTFPPPYTFGIPTVHLVSPCACSPAKVRRAQHCTGFLHLTIAVRWEDHSARSDCVVRCHICLHGIHCWLGSIGSTVAIRDAEKELARVAAPPTFLPHPRSVRARAPCC